MKIGFTGTRNGMTAEQFTTFVVTMNRICPRELHHGVCVGSDEDAACWTMVRFRGECVVIAHPGRSANRPEENHNRSVKAMLSSHQTDPEKTHFARNRDIVDQTEMLIATPPCQPVPDSGGTRKAGQDEDPQ